MSSLRTLPSSQFEIVLSDTSRQLKTIATLAIGFAWICLWAFSAQGQTIKADYRFQNNRLSAVGSSSLTDTGAVGNTFQQEVVDGQTRTVLRFPFNNGLRLSQSNLQIPSNSYTIVMLFKVDSVSGFVRLVDFKNRSTDNGLYIENGHLENCQTCTGIAANSYVQVVYTRNTSGTFAAYVNGVLQGQGPDVGNDLVIDGNNILNFFQDDNVFANEASAGSVARIRLYDAPMTGAQVAALDRLAPACTFSLSPTSQGFASPNGNSTTVDVTAGPACGWVATSNDSWITINSGTPGSGNGTVNYTVAANTTGAQRTGSMTIAGINFVVTQEGVCTAPISPTSAPYTSVGGSGAISVSGSQFCTWNAVSNDNWITITSGSSGLGSGTVNYTVAANTANTPRTGTLTVANNTFTVNQQAAPLMITGRVVDAAGNSISEVSVALTGTGSNNTSTDGNGEYSFTNLTSGGNYVVTPSSSAYSFSPPNHTFNGVTANRVGNFVATRTVVAITGKVTDASNVGINNVTVALSTNGAPAGTVQTDALGNYSFGSLAPGATYAVTPTGSFTPSSQSFNSLVLDAVANFTAAPSIPPQCNTVSFGRTDFSAGTGPESVAIGDFNNDGKSDLALANANSSNVSILIGTGTGTFGTATNFAVGTDPNSVVVGDFNGDGNSDLAVANRTSNNISVLLGTGTGSFGTATNFAAGIGPQAVAIGDFNNDGNRDLVVVNPGTADNISVLLGTGTGGFGAPTNFVVGATPLSVAVGDFNGDGRTDLAVANGSSNDVSVLLGTGTGSFGSATNFAAGTGPISVAVGDFNGDGRDDLAVANDASDDVSILLGTGAGSFGAATNFGAGSSPESVAVGDLNGDGKSDLAVAQFSSANVSVLLGTGTGTFGAPSDQPTASENEAVALGDFNGDGKTDMAVAKAVSNAVSVLLNTGTTCNTLTSLTISGRLATANDSPLAGVVVTLSGPITRVVETNATGDYTFGNLSPGGNFAVTVQSPYYVFAPSRVDFFNLSSNQTANFTAAPVVVPSPLPPPSDNFNSTERDATKWSLGTATQPPGSFDPRVNVRQIDGKLVISPLAQASGPHYNGYVSANSFDMRGGSITAELVRPASGGADTIFAIGSDSQNFYRFVVRTAGGPTGVVNTVTGIDGVERPLDETVAQLLFQVSIGGQITTLPIPYDPVLHRFKRFRHLALTNELLFETSPNNIDFAERHRVTLTRSVSSLIAELSAGTSNPTNPGSAEFESVSLVVSTFQFSSANYTVGESAGSILITVTRSGSTAGSATVDYATADGTARQATRYINTAGRLTFAAGETTKTFLVLIVDNVHAEGDQNLDLLLQNPVGPGLNTPGRAVLTITDNDTTVATSNPVDTATFYVTQHYFDFLNRQPDAGGLAFWVNEITSCNGEPSCVERKRINVSAAYFLSIEFQETGFLAHRFYNLALNRPNGLPRYLEFLRDTQAIGRGVVIGAPGAEALLEANKVIYANEFAARTEFTALYPVTQTPAQYVDALYLHAGITPSATERQAAIDEFNNPTGARGRVLRRIADNATLRTRETNRAFVLAQYFGYLRRNPDDAPDNNLDGYNFWLNKLNQFNGDYIAAEMVKAFITSGEYRRRFGP